MKRPGSGLTAIALIAAGCFSGYSADDAFPRESRVHRGNFVNEITLTGELESARGEAITVPNLPSWQTSIKWIADDGAEVKRGDRVVELDNSQFTSGLDAKRQAVANGFGCVLPFASWLWPGPKTGSAPAVIRTGPRYPPA